MNKNTVNVIFYKDSTIQSIVSFLDNEEGNEKAEELFISKANKMSPDSEFDEDSFGILDNGYFESDDGEQQLFLTHSSDQIDLLEA